MTEDPSTAPESGSIPETEAPLAGDYSQATLEQVTFAVTGKGPNIHGALEKGRAPDGGWFNFGEGMDETREVGAAATPYMSYGAWDKWYFTARRNEAVFADWRRLFNEMNELMTDMFGGKVGYLDVPRLKNAAEVARHYVNWLMQNLGLIQSWETRLTSDHSEFEGKAANAIRENLAGISAVIEGLLLQITIERSPNTPYALEKAAGALEGFSKILPVMWAFSTFDLAALPERLAYAVELNIAQYITGSGLTGEQFNGITKALGREGTEEYIRKVIGSYSSNAVSAEFPIGSTVTTTETRLGKNDQPQEVLVDRVVTSEQQVDLNLPPLPEELGTVSGPLDQQSTWDLINDRISQAVLNRLRSLDEFAREQLQKLETAYGDTRGPLAELYPPTVPTPGGGGGGAGPGPQGFPEITFEDPPPFKFDPPPKFEFGPPPKFDPPPGMPDLGDLGKLDPGDLGNLGGLDDLGKLGGPGGLDGLGNLGGPGGLDGLGNLGDLGNRGNLGDLEGQGPGGHMPPPVPFPPYSGPGGNGPSNPKDPGKWPDYPDLGPGPDGRGPSGGNIEFPPGGSVDDLPPGSDFTLPDGSTGGSTLTGGPGDSGGGFPGSENMPEGGPQAGQGAGGQGAGGQGWSDWTGESGEQQGSQQPEGTGSLGGRPPMMPPPMMPPMNPGNQKERERQTWLSEDDKVWGTASLAGSGVIGLPADLAKEVDEQLAPVHVHVRTVDPRTKPDGQQEPARKPAQAEQAEQQS